MSRFYGPHPRISFGITLEGLSSATHWASVQVLHLTEYCWHRPLLPLAVTGFRTCAGVSSAAVVLCSQARSSPPVPREVEGAGAAGPRVKQAHHTEFADKSQIAHKGRCLAFSCFSGLLLTLPPSPTSKTQLKGPIRNSGPGALSH